MSIVQPAIDETQFYVNHDLSRPRHVAIEDSTSEEQDDELHIDQTAGTPISTSQETMHQRVLFDQEVVPLHRRYLGISNIRHELTVPKLQQTYSPETMLRSHKDEYTSQIVTAKDIDEHLPQSLRQLLNLKQTAQVNLVDYFNVLTNITSADPFDTELENICLRRFIDGISDPMERTFIQGWLQDGRLSLQNTRDAVVLLQRWPVTKVLLEDDSNVDEPSLMVPALSTKGNPLREEFGESPVIQYRRFNHQSLALSQTQPAIRLKPNVTTRAAAAAKQHSMEETETTMLIPSQSRAVKSKVAKTKHASKSKKQKCRKRNQPDVADEDTSHISIQENAHLERGRKRLREDNVYDLPSTPRTPTKHDRDGKMDNRRKRMRTTANVEQVIHDYPSSPPVDIQVPQSSPLQDRQRRRNLRLSS